jgi:hypothetical protein
MITRLHGGTSSDIILIDYRNITNDDFRRQKEAVMLHSLSICLERLSKTVNNSEEPEPGIIGI